MRAEKESIVAETKLLLDGSNYVFLVDYTGLQVEKMAELRNRLQVSGAHMRVVRNRFLKHIARDKGWEDLATSMAGPTAMITGDDDLAAARVLVEFARGTGRPALKCGISSDGFVSGDDIAVMATLPSLDVMRSILLGTAAAPMRNLVGVLAQKLRSVLYALKAAAEKKAAA